ncbi:nucleoporin [Cryptosporidium ryanae]|uniref:nucleoporin n=1 Tax=Cryptosporidium ryanae TaxID=515981 RepID=UPI00351A84DE|nr:nucleoporin [Cryptosporidium ryanae]
MLGGGGFGSSQNQQSSGGLFGTSGSFGVGIGQQGVPQNNVNSSMQQPSLFGSSTPLFSGGNLGSGLFGNTSTSGTGFGATGSSSAFGQSSNGLFGQSIGTFGNNQQMGSTQSSIFGSGTGANTGIFGSSTGSNSGVFGSFSNSFGSTTGFGNQISQQNNSNGFFGQQANNSMFGSSPVQGFGNVSSSPFGGNLGASSNIFGSRKGTNGITFQPLVDRDSDARIMSIVYQKDVDQKKSVEELRWEDYQEKRGPSSSLPKSDLGFQTNSNTFGSSSFSNSGFFGSSSQNQSVSNSVFGQSQNSSFINSNNSQSSIFGGNSSSLGQPSVLGQGIQSGQQGLGSSQFGSGNNNSLFGNSLTNSNSFSLQSSPSNSATGLFSSGLFSSNTNNSSLFGQSSTNSNIFDNSLKTSGGLFGSSNAASNTGLNLFGTNGSNQQISSGGQSLGNKSLFGTSQSFVNSGIGGSILNGTSGLSSANNIIGSTQPISNGLLANNNISGSLLFGSSSSLSQSSISNNNSLSIGSNLFGSSSSLSLPLNTGNTNPGSSIWPNITSSQTNSNFGAANSTKNEVSNNSLQYQNILGAGNSKTISNSQNSIYSGTNFSNSNMLSGNNVIRPVIQNSLRYSDSADRGKALWLWKPLPQYISRPSRYKLDTSTQISVNDKSVSSSELALPALATESAKHNSLLLSSVRRVEKAIDLQTPATFLSLLERQQQFFDAIQSPDSNNTSPVNTRIKSMIFSKPHTSHFAKITSIDENFEDAIDDSNPVFSPKTNTCDRKLNNDGAKSLLNLESISRISQNVQFSRKSETRGSISRASIENNNASRTPHSNQQRTSISSVIIGSDRPQTRTSIGLTTPRPILRRFDNLNGDNFISEANKSNQFQNEQVVKSLVPILTKSDYFCIPSIEVLKTFSEDRLAIVEDFRIVREGVGEIMWPGITDLRGINLDLVVSIEPLCVSVYGDDDSPVPIGEGLNKKALVILKNCKPKKMASLVDTDEIERYKNNRVNQIKNYTEQMGARFISLDTNTWEWKFEVSHFSRYGLVSKDGISMIDSSKIILDVNMVSNDKKTLNPLQKTKLELNLDDKRYITNYDSINCFFHKKNQYRELNSFYLEAISILEGYKSREKNIIYNNLSFRSGIYIGSHGIVVVPHKPSGVSSRSFYNTSITIFKLKKNQFSLKNKQGQIFGLPRRVISFWLRIYIEIIGNPENIDNLNLGSILKLTFLMWNVVKKETLLASSNLIDKVNSTLRTLEFCEETLCFLAGILEILVKYKEKLSHIEIEGRLNEYFLWWVRFVNDKKIHVNERDTTRQKEISSDSVDNRISKLCSYLQFGNITDLISTQFIDGFLDIPRTASLCLSIGSNKSSIEQFKKNFQWWIGVGICSEFSNTAFKLYREIANMNLMSHISDIWPIFCIVNNSPNCKTPNQGDDLKVVYEKSKNRTVVKSNDVINKYNGLHKHRKFEDIQFQIMSFFTAGNKINSIKSLEYFYRTNSDIQLDFPFYWFITRILTLCHQIIYKDDNVLFSQPKLHLLFIHELELLGMWEWAAYVAVHLNINNKLYSSNNIFNSIITRNINEISSFSRPDEYTDSKKWNFLVNTIGIPLSWLIEAMVYKSNASGNIIQSVKFAIYLIDYFKNKRYTPGDLFFQHKLLDHTKITNNLVFFAFIRLFDDHIMPKTLIEISATIWNEISNEESCKNNNYLSNLSDINQFTELEKLFLIAKNTEKGEPVPEDIWRITNLILNISYNFILISKQTLRGECLNRESYNAIGSLIGQVLSAREMNIGSIEYTINNIIKNDCWEIILRTIETIN